MAHPRDIGKKEPLTSVCRSAHLEKSIRLYQQPEIQEQLFQLPSPTSITPDKEVHSTTLGVQLRPLTQAKAPTGISRPFQSRSKEEAE